MTAQLDGIETEVVQIILEYAVESSPHTSRSLLLANKFLNAAVRKVQDQKKTLCLEYSIQESLKSHPWTDKDEVLQNIRHLVVEHRGGWERWDDDFEKRFGPFNELVQRIAKLKSFTWNAGPIPRSLLKALHAKHPTAVLKTFKFIRLYPERAYLDDAEDALATYPTLTHFRASGKRCQLSKDLSDPGFPDLSLAAFKEIVGRSRSLEYAGIVMARSADVSGIMQSSAQSEEAVVACQTKKRKRCETLKHLTLDGSQLTLSKAVLEELDMHVNVSKLESLKFSRGLPVQDYFENATTLLPSLKHVSFNFTALQGRSTPSTVPGTHLNPTLKAAREYLLECPPLLSLSLWSWRRTVELHELLGHHGQMLRTLQLHEREDVWNPGHHGDHNLRTMRTDMSVGDVRQIRAYCPRLRDLTIDINLSNVSFDLATDHKMLEAIDELGRFQPPLERVQIYFNSDQLSELLHGRQSSESDSDMEQDGGEDYVELELEVVVIDAQDDALDSGEIGSGTDMTTAQVAPDQIETMSTMQARTHATTNRKPIPDPETVVQEYVKSIWERLFSNVKSGARTLDVKFGEWESRMNANFYDTNLDPRSYYEVRPHERNDKVRECMVKLRKRTMRL